MRPILSISALALACVFGCSSSSGGNNTGTSGTGAGGATSTTSGGGSMCSGLTSSSKPVYASVTKAAGSDANCPAISPGMLNGGVDDGGSSDCPPTINGCTVTIDCMTGGGRVTGSFTVSASSFTGTISAMVAGIACSYDVAGSIQ